MDYASFLAKKSQCGQNSGFSPLWLPDTLFDFQKHLTEWAIRKGRSAIFADCGLGKTPIELVWSENMVRHTNRPVLLLTPLAVGPQIVREGEKFGVECYRSRNGKFPSGSRVVVTNYEQLDKFNPNDFGGVACDESGGIRHFDSVRTETVTEFLRTIPYRLLATATAAPNDYVELGTSAEALGEMGHADMVTRFFKEKYACDFRGWSRKKYHLRAYAEHDFWRWICSWARACRKPSDLGFDDGPFILPPLETEQHEVKAKVRQEGVLFDLPAITQSEVCQERRRSLRERCEKMAELADHDRPFVCWCNLNPEGDLLTKLIPGTVQVSGSDRDDVKEEKLAAFSQGQYRVLVTKPSIASHGLNWQHCSDTGLFPTDSYEAYYQLVRRFYRFGQKKPVKVHLVTSEGEGRVLANLERKDMQADAMFSKLVKLMNDALGITVDDPYTSKAKAPSWLSATNS